MRGDDRTLRDLQYVLDSADAQVAHIEHHADPLHLGDRFYSRRGQPAACRILGTAIGKRAPTKMRHRGDTHAEPMHCLEQFDTLINTGHTFESQHERDALVLQGAVDLFTVEADPNRIGVLCGNTVPRLDHTQRSAQRPLRTILIVDEYRKHLQIDASCLQLWQPPLSKVWAPASGIARRHRAKQVIVRIGDNCPGVQFVRGVHALTRRSARPE